MAASFDLTIFLDSLYLPCFLLLVSLLFPLPLVPDLWATRLARFSLLRFNPSSLFSSTSSPVMVAMLVAVVVVVVGCCHWSVPRSSCAILFRKKNQGRKGAEFSRDEKRRNSSWGDSEKANVFGENVARQETKQEERGLGRGPRWKREGETQWRNEERRKRGEIEKVRERQAGTGGCDSAQFIPDRIKPRNPPLVHGARAVSRNNDSSENITNMPSPSSENV